MSGLKDKEVVRTLLEKAHLTPREQQVICKNFDLSLPDGVEPLDPGVSPARLRQIEAKALRKIAAARERSEG